MYGKYGGRAGYGDFAQTIGAVHNVASLQVQQGEGAGDLFGGFIGPGAADLHLRAGGIGQATWSLADTDYPHVTLDLSHTSVSKSDPLAWLDELGERVAHLHLADGSGSWHDDHLVPGRGNQPCTEVLERLEKLQYKGIVVLEVNTRRALSHEERVADLAESLAFTRAALAAAPA